MSENVVARVSTICREYGSDAGRMIDIARDVQSAFGEVSGEAITIIANETGATVGGTAPGARNIIANNNVGVVVGYNNAASDDEISILGNEIFDNAWPRVKGSPGEQLFLEGALTSRHQDICRDVCENEELPE